MENPPTAVSTPKIIILLASGSLNTLAAYTPVLCTADILFSHLTVQEQFDLTAVLRNTTRPSTPPFNLADSLDQPVNSLPHAAHHTLALANGLIGDPDCLLLIHLGDGLSQSAQQQLWQNIRTAQQERPRLVFFVTANPNAISALADEIWQIEEGKIVQKWKTAALPAHIFPAARYRLTFSSRQTAVSFHQTINAAAADFGLLHCAAVPNDQRTLDLSVDDKKRIAALVRTAGYDLVTFHTMEPQLTMGNGRLTTNGQLSAAEPVSLKAITAIARSEWRRHFRAFWRGGNVLLSNILLLMMALGTLQAAGQLPTISWMLMFGITLLMSAAMPIGWGVEAMYQWRKKRDGLSYAQTLPVAPLTLWGGLVGGQAFILLTHTAVFFALLTFAFIDNIPFIFVCALFWGMMVINTLALIPLLAHIPRSTGQAWLVGWGAFIAIIFGGALLNRFPAAYWPIAWLWPFTADLTAFARSSSTAYLVIPVSFSLFTSILWIWLGIRLFSQSTAAT